jgi:hypothetical protein
MRANLKNLTLAGLCLFCLITLSACGGGGGGSSADTDGDGIANSVDNCPTIANPDQADANGNGIGNVCEALAADADGDGIPDSVDNCPTTVNPDQADTDHDGIGNVCDPTPLADVFNWTGNTRLTVISAAGLLANDLPGTVISAINTATTQGAVNVNMTTGAFTYDPPVGLQNTADTFTYTVAGDPVPATVTINLAERVWYVRNTDIGVNPGNDQAPFTTLAQAVTAADLNDTIFVFTGDPLNPTAIGQDAGIVLKAGQKLIGQGFGLKFNGVTVVPARPNNPVISNAALPGAAALNLPVIQLASGNEVSGLTINATFNEAILALAGSGYNLHDNTINITAVTGREGIRLLSVTGNNNVTVNTISGSTRNGIKLVNNEDQAGNAVPATPVTATVTLSRNIISGSAQDGMRVNYDGAGTDVKLNVLTNTVTASGGAGVNINSLGAAKITPVLSRNKVSNSTNRAIDLVANATSTMPAFVVDNALSASGVVGDFRALTAAATSNICVELINNSNAVVLGPGNSTFRVDNGIAGILQFFERANDTLAVRVPLTLPSVAEGACAVPLNGAALFEANCAVCHTGNGLGREVKKDLLARDITGRTAAVINAQFTTLPNLSMIGVFVDVNGRLRLTQQEITAIAAALVPTP